MSGPWNEDDRRYADAAARALGGEPGHDAAFRAAVLALELAPGLRDRPGYAALLGPPTLRERVVARFRALTETLQAFGTARTAAFASVLVLVAVGTGWFLLNPGSAADYGTAIAETRTIRLADSSDVTLGAKSSLRTEFASRERRVILDSGEAFFEVAHDTSRPFVVIAGRTRVTVTGTRFNVKRVGDDVRVSVAQGSVTVERLQASGAVQGRAVHLVAGEQAIADQQELAAVHDASPLEEAGEWRKGQLSYEDAPLAEVVADANRYRAQPIRIASGALAGARLTTSFRTDQIELMLATLPDTLPLRIRRQADGSIDLVPR